MARAARQAAPVARAKALPREVARALVGQITMRDDEMGDGQFVFTVRVRGLVVGRAFGDRKTLVELAREHFGGGGVLKRSRERGTWLVFK